MFQQKSRVLLAFTSVTIGVAVPAVMADPFTNTSSWSTYDPGANGVGADPDGFAGTVFDGRYVYFVPHYNGAANSGEVLCYDTRCAGSGSFQNATCWAAYDYSQVCTPLGCTNPVGYDGGVFDGRYVYFAPSPRVGLPAHGEFLRYDTTAAFTVAGSWRAYDPGSNGVGSDPDGFSGGIYDGRYIYFIPTHNGTSASGEVLRYDTTAAFDSTTSWTSFIPTNNGVGTNLRGYAGGAFDGRYVYFAPYDNESPGPNGKVMRFDTQAAGGFQNAASWQAYDVRGEWALQGATPALFLTGATYISCHILTRVVPTRAGRYCDTTHRALSRLRARGRDSTRAPTA